MVILSIYNTYNIYQLYVCMCDYVIVRNSEKATSLTWLRKFTLFTFPMLSFGSLFFLFFPVSSSFSFIPSNFPRLVPFFSSMFRSPLVLFFDQSDPGHISYGKKNNSRIRFCESFPSLSFSLRDSSILISSFFLSLLLLIYFNNWAGERCEDEGVTKWEIRDKKSVELIPQSFFLLNLRIFWELENNWDEKTKVRRCLGERLLQCTKIQREEKRWEKGEYPRQKIEIRIFTSGDPWVQKFITSQGNLREILSRLVSFPFSLVIMHIPVYSKEEKEKKIDLP